MVVVVAAADLTGDSHSHERTLRAPTHLQDPPGQRGSSSSDNLPDLPERGGGHWRIITLGTPNKAPPPPPRPLAQAGVKACPQRAQKKKWEWSQDEEDEWGVGRDTELSVTCSSLVAMTTPGGSGHPDRRLQEIRWF